LGAPPVPRVGLLLAGLLATLGWPGSPASSRPDAHPEPEPSVAGFLLGARVPPGLGVSPSGQSGDAPIADTDHLRWPSPPDGGPSAVLLEEALLREGADETLEPRATLPAGTVVGFQARVRDAFGRPWSRISDPTTQVQETLRVLAPFGRERLERWDRTAAFLEIPAAPPPGPAAGTPPTAGQGGPVAPATPPPSEAWWTRVVFLGPEHLPAFVGARGADAAVVPGPVLDDVLALVGGLSNLGPFPEEPLPGQLFVPAFLPLILRFDGARWVPTEPALLQGPAPGLLGNPDLAPETGSPAGPLGPPIPCWRLIGGRGPEGNVVGTVAVQPATPASPGVPGAAGIGPGSGPGGAGGPAGPSGGPSGGLDLPLQRLWPTAPRSAAVPARLPGPEPVPGIRLRDDTYEQAVQLAQDLHPDLVRRLRGRELVLEVVARAPPRSTGPAALGIAVLAGDERFQAGQTVGTRSTTASLTFTVPPDAESLSVRLLPLDVSVAIEQQGEVLLETARLRPAGWPSSYRAEVLLLHEVVATVWPDATRYVRAELAVTDRPREEARELWAEIRDRDWDLETVRAVLAGRAVQGMSPGQVLAAWGEPERRVRGADAAGLDERWDYADRSAAFVDGVLLAATVEPERDAAPTSGRRCWDPSDGGRRLP